jgi:hypothetical protein
MATNSRCPYAGHQLMPPLHRPPPHTLKKDGEGNRPWYLEVWKEKGLDWGNIWSRGGQIRAIGEATHAVATVAACSLGRGRSVPSSCQQQRHRGLLEIYLCCSRLLARAKLEMSDGFQNNERWFPKLPLFREK